MQRRWKPALSLPYICLGIWLTREMVEEVVEEVVEEMVEEMST